MDFPRAPRFHAYLTERLGIGTMPSSDWSAQEPGSSGPFLMQESAMPFAGALGTICVVGEPSTSDHYLVRRYREDLDDPPHGRINVDTFKV